MQVDVKKTATHQQEAIGRALLRSSEKDRQALDAEFKQWLKNRVKKGAPAHA